MLSLLLLSGSGCSLRTTRSSRGTLTRPSRCWRRAGTGTGGTGSRSVSLNLCSASKFFLLLNYGNFLRFLDGLMGKGRMTLTANSFTQWSAPPFPVTNFVSWKNWLDPQDLNSSLWRIIYQFPSLRLVQPALCQFVVPWTISACTAIFCSIFLRMNWKLTYRFGIFDLKLWHYRTWDMRRSGWSNSNCYRVHSVNNM